MFNANQSKNRRVLVGLLVLIAITGFAFSVSTFGSDYKARTLKLGHIAAENHPVHEWALMFKKTLEDLTDGKMKVDIYPQGQLGTGQNMSEGLKFGAVDVALLDVSFYSFVSEAQILEYPFLYKNYDHFRATQDGEIGKRIQDNAEKKGFKLLGWAEFGRRHMTNNKGPISKPEDLKGLRMRVPPGAIYVTMMEAMGAKVTPIDFSELYLALQLGTADGQENPLSSIVAVKMSEVQKYLSLTGHMYTLLYPSMDMKAFKALNDKEQMAVLEASKAATQYTRTYVEEVDESYLQSLMGAGMKVNTVDPAAFSAITDTVAEKLQSKVPIKWVEEIRALN